MAKPHQFNPQLGDQPKTKREKLRFKDYMDWRASEETVPLHQAARGPRHGNNRKMYADLKVKERRISRARENQQLRTMDFGDDE